MLARNGHPKKQGAPERHHARHRHRWPCEHRALEALSAWLTDHPGLTVKEPFRCIADTIHNILEDGIIGK